MSDIKQSQAPFDNYGLQHGEWIGYYDNGNLWYRHNYVHGISHGLHEGYQPNGRLRYRGYRNMGIRVGYWIWDETKQYYLCLV